MKNDKSSLMYWEDFQVHRGSKTVIPAISLKVGAGTTAFLGSRRAGKTLLMQTPNRLAEEDPRWAFQGKVFYRGKDVADCAKSGLRRKLFYLFPDPEPFPLSIRENILLSMRSLGNISRIEREERMVQALKDVHLWRRVRDRLEHQADFLQDMDIYRLALARGLVHQPDFLLLDEPASSVPVYLHPDLMDLISRLKERYNLLLSTQDPLLARRMADVTHFFAPEKGLVESGETKTLLDNPSSGLLQIYLTKRRRDDR